MLLVPSLLDLRLSLPRRKLPRQALEVAHHVWDILSIGFAGDKMVEAQVRRALEMEMANVTTYEQWVDAARALDVMDDNFTWRKELRDPRLEQRTRLLDQARLSGSIREMAVAARTYLSRDLGVMGDINTYKRARVESPNVIRSYVYSACQLLDALANHPDLSSDNYVELLDVFQDAIASRQQFGRTALFLSGGATFGMAHIGVCKAMWERGVLPKIITGASAGSIVVAVLCTTTDEEIPALLQSFQYQDLAVFDDVANSTSLSKRLARLAMGQTWADSSHLRRVMESLLGDTTFLEAYHKTGRICNITVSAPHRYHHRLVLNYITAPNATIASAVVASCAVPLFFEPFRILAKDPRTRELMDWNMMNDTFIDGSVHSDLPMLPISEMFNVNHFVVSQANPHVTPVISEDHERRTTPMTIGINMALGEIHHRCEQIVESDLLPHGLATLITKLTSITSQNYTGDITTIPRMHAVDHARLLRNPTPEFMEHSCLQGERAVWPQLQRMKDRIAIESAIDAGLATLRARIAFHPKAGASRRAVLNAATKSLVSRTTQRHGHGQLRRPSDGLPVVSHRVSIATLDAASGLSERPRPLSLKEPVATLKLSRSFHLSLPISNNEPPKDGPCGR